MTKLSPEKQAKIMEMLNYKLYPVRVLECPVCHGSMREAGYNVFFCELCQDYFDLVSENVVK